jgi:hypothetical protein
LTGREQPPSESLISTVRQAEIRAKTGVLRVEVVGDVGYLFFSKGELVHACTLDQEGEVAASAIANWQPTLAPCWCERRWPRARTVSRKFVDLLEEGRLQAPSVAPPPVELREPEPPSEPVDESARFPSTFGLRQVLSRAEFKNALRMRSGVVGDSRGSSGHLRSIVQATMMLGDSLGAALGVGSLIAAEASAPGFHRLLARSVDELAVVETADGSSLPLTRAFLKLG